MSDIEADVSDYEAAPAAPDTSADDAKYAAMEAKYAGRDKEPEAANADTGGEEGEAETEAKAVERKPLAPEEVEKRWNDTKAALKETRREARELKENLARLQAQRDEQAQEKDAIEALVASLRDDDDDPIEDIATLKRTIKEFMSRQQAETAAERAQQQQQKALTSFHTSVAEGEAEFKADNPDYDDAVKHFRQSVREELEEQGLSGNELEKEFATTLINLARKAMDADRNPAEVVYSLAKKRGFKGGSAASKVEDKIAATQADIDKAAEKIQTLKQGQQAGRSLSSVGSSAGTGGQVTLASAAKKTGKELLADYQKLKAQAKRTGNYR